MALTYLEQQKQYAEFLDELDALFRKHNIEHVYATDSTIHLSRSAYDTWTFGSWIIRNDGTRRYTRPGISEYCLNTVDTDSSNTETAPTESDTEVLATVEPLVDEPVTMPTTMSEPVIENSERTTVQDNPQVNVQVNPQDNVQDNKQEVILSESDIKPELERYISDLAERIYSTAKEMGFPKIIPGNYWSHPKVINAVKQGGFNESAYTIIASNGTYWNEVIKRIKAIELTDKPQKAEPVAKPEVTKEPVTQTETYSTDAKVGIWTISSPDHPESVFLDSEKGRSTICNKAYGWFLIYTHMHPELKNAPTRANISETFTENFNKRQSFRYKWYEFVVDVSYSTPIESENTDNA